MKHFYLAAFFLVIALVLVHQTTEASQFHLRKKLHNFFQNSPLGGLFTSSHCSDYDKINEHLSEAVKNDDVEANLRAAEALMDDKSKSHSEKTLIEALKEFLSLREVYNGQKLCTRSSADILNKANKSARDALKRISSTEQPNGANVSPIRRLDRIIHQVAIKHIEECPKNYQAELEKLYEKMPIKITSRAGSFAESFLASHMIMEQFEGISGLNTKPIPELNQEAQQFMLDHPLESIEYLNNRMKPIHSKDDGELIYMALDRWTQDQPTSRSSHALHDVDQDGDVYYQALDELFTNDLINVCVDYSNWLNGIMEPLKFDLEYSDRLEQIFPHGQASNPLLLNLLHYETCNKFLMHKDEAKKAFVDHVKYFNIILQ